MATAGPNSHQIRALYLWRLSTTQGPVALTQFASDVEDIIAQRTDLFAGLPDTYPRRRVTYPRRGGFACVIESLSDAPLTNSVRQPCGKRAGYPVCGDCLGQRDCGW